MHARVRINVGGQGVDTGCRTLVDLGDDEVVHRHYERHNESADDTGGYDGNHNFDESLERICAEVESRFVDVGVHRFEFGKHAQNDVGGAERYVRDDESQISFGESERDEEHHHGNRHNDFAVDDGELVDVFNDTSCALAEVEDADRGERTHNRRHDGRYARDDKRVCDCAPKFRRFVGFEYRNVRLETESVVEIEVGTVGKRVHDEKDYRRVQYREDNQKIELFKKAYNLFFYHSDLLTALLL